MSGFNPYTAPQGARREVPDPELDLSHVAGCLFDAWESALQLQLHNPDQNVRERATRICRALESARLALDRIRYPKGFGR